MKTNLFAVKVGEGWAGKSPMGGYVRVESFDEAEYFNTQERAHAAAKTLWSAVAVKITAGPLWDVVKEPDSFFVHGTQTDDLGRVLSYLAGDDHDKSKVEVRINGKFYDVRLES